MRRALSQRQRSLHLNCLRFANEVMRSAFYRTHLRGAGNSNQMVHLRTTMIRVLMEFLSRPTAPYRSPLLTSVTSTFPLTAFE
jgi:hypothetical protein